MYVVLLGILCGIAAAILILLAVCLCHRCGLFNPCLASPTKTADYPIIMFPSPNVLAGQSEYIQPSFADSGDLEPPGRPPPLASIVDPMPGPVDPLALHERLAQLADDDDATSMPLGQLEFTLEYDSDAMALDGVVVMATQLPIVRGRAPTTIVHVTLFPGQHYKFQTGLKREEAGPRFDESFRFGVVDLDELVVNGLLQFRVCHSDWLRTEELIGWFDVHLGDYGKERLCDGVRETRLLSSPSLLRKTSSMSSQSSFCETPLSSAHDLGDEKTPETLRHHFSFVSVEKSSAESYRSRHSDATPPPSESDHSDGNRVEASPRRALSLQKRQGLPRKVSRTGGGMIQLSISYSEENARLLVIVLKAKDLPMRKGGQAPDVVVRMHLYSNLDRRKHSKKSTSVKRANPDPVFNESFTLHCLANDLDHVTLVVSVMDHQEDRVGKVLLGRVSLGAESSGEREARHWLDVVSKETAGRNVTAWHALRK